MSNLLTVKDLQHTFVEGKLSTPVLKGINLCIKEGEVLALLGASGSGKTTFLQIIGGLQSFSSGEVSFIDQSYSRLDDAHLTALRETNFGFVYQFHHLLPELTALENVMIPLMIRKINKKDALMQAQTMLEEVGLGHRLTHKPAELSGGERQRVALARAMVKHPHILFADEPTGNLDRESSEKIFELMLKMNQQFNTTIVFITHDEHLASRAMRVLRMEDGKLLDQ